MKTLSGKFRALAVLFVLVSLTSANLLYVSDRVNAQQGLPYKDPKLSIDARVRDLLARMTIEEKAAQMMCLWDERPIDKSRVAKELMPYGGDFSPELAKLRMPYGIGQFASQREEHDPSGSAEFN